jgi:uncharacterized protein (DUF952 family)
MLFHILSREAWSSASADARYMPPSLATDGFIHLSTAEQLLPTAERYFAGRTDLVVLAIDPARIDAELRYEEAHGESFPHLYGSLAREAVVGVEPLILVGGRFVFPGSLED